MDNSELGLNAADSSLKVNPNTLQFRRPYSYTYTLDVLTDGSEYTGNGTVFLTISKPSSTGTTDEAILARYALSGVSTLISRLAADQAFKLSSVRAVFCPSRKDVDCIAGIPSLLLALANYSLNGKLHVVGDQGMDGFMDHVADLVLKRRNYPEIVTCVVPSNNDDARTWWKVYDDEYIVVHARIGVGNAISQSDDESEGSGDSSEDSDDDDDSSTSSSRKESQSQGLEQKEHTSTGTGTIEQDDHASLDQCQSIVYIVTLHNTPRPYSFAVLPPGTDAFAHPNILSTLPDNLGVGQTATSSGEKPLDFILHMNPLFPKSFNVETKHQVNVPVRIPNKLHEIAKRHVATLPCNLQGSGDNGLLIRAIHQNRALHEHLPFAFPDSHSATNKCSLNIAAIRSDEIYNADDTNHSLVPIQRLTSCTSAVLETGDVDFTSRMHELIRHETITDKIKSRDGESSTFELELIKDKVAKASLFYMPNFAEDDGPDKQDDNEIDLSEEDDSDDDGSDEDTKDPPIKRMKTQARATDGPVSKLNTKAAHMLVLGTGCASPSPLRGSSAYAIFLPTIMNGQCVLTPSLVLECGEGFLTMLHRHSPTEQSIEQHLSQIRLIWISHAHLDHYGGLPHLIHEIIKVNKNTEMCTCYQKGGKRELCSPPSSRNETRTDDSTGMHRPLCKRCLRTCPPIVIAPTKVLRYLDCALDCKNGIIGEQKMYVGISQRDFDTSPFSQQVRDDVFGIELMTIQNSMPPTTYHPITFLKNIPVEHCPNAYAVLIGLNTATVTLSHSNNDNDHHQPPQSLFTLCYSGDTRPSSNIVRECRNFSKTCRRNVSLLLHEATFDDDEKGKGEAIRKRHSTVEEAMGIANQIDLDSILMTHFSQRYPKFPPGHDADTIKGQGESRDASTSTSTCSSNGSLEVAFAYDGMLIPLTDGLRPMMPLIGSLAASILTMS